MYEKTENGIRCIYLENDDVMDKETAEAKWLGQWVEEEDANLIVGGEEDVNVYKPGTNLFGDSELLVAFRHNVFPSEITRPAYEALRDAAGVSNNRGLSAGPLEQTRMSGNRKIAESDGHRATVYKNDGSISKTTYANAVNSGIVGFFDPYPRDPYCRMTAFTERHRDKFEAAIPFIKAISQQFEKCIPEKFNNQKRFCNGTNSDFVIAETAFTTITVNRNFRTAGHYDAGDLEQGFGNLCVLEHLDGPSYTGAHTVFPRYGVGINVREGDFAGMDVHELHGNTKMICEDGGLADGDRSTTKAERVSIVSYARSKMIKCSSMEDELAKKEAWNNKVKQLRGEGYGDNAIWNLIEESGEFNDFEKAGT